MELNIKFLFFFYIYLFFLFYSCSSGVSITPVEVSQSWRGTPGKLVVKKGFLVDTIYDCQFGNTPEYKLLKHLGKAYLYTSCEMNNGGDNYQTFALWSLEDTTFLDTLYFNNLNISKEIRMNDKTFNWIRRKGNLKLDKNTIIFEMDSIVTQVENDVTIDTISFGKSIKRFQLN
jgi:hypothetical protein